MLPKGPVDVLVIEQIANVVDVPQQGLVDARPLALLVEVVGLREVPLQGLLLAGLGVIRGILRVERVEGDPIEDEGAVDVAVVLLFLTPEAPTGGTAQPEGEGRELLLPLAPKPGLQLRQLAHARYPLNARGDGAAEDGDALLDLVVGDLAVGEAELLLAGLVAEEDFARAAEHAVLQRQLPDLRRVDARVELESQR